MSLDIWPPVPAAELKVKEAETQARELQWITNETVRVCRDLKHGLEDCYALLAPIDPGSTLAVSTPRNERVKGTITRVGTRIVKASIALRLATMPPMTLTLSPSTAIHLHALDALHTHLTQSLDLLSVLLSRDTPPDPDSLAQTLTLLSESLSESAELLKGSNLGPMSYPSWQLCSCPPDQFSPPLGPNVSVYLNLQDSCVVLSIRALEPVHAPVHLGTRLGLAIGTVRRLEHDEMDTVFAWDPAGCDTADSKRDSARHTPVSTPNHRASNLEEVYVREKVRVESPDPSLISLYSKLGFLSHMLAQARRNLAAVMGTDLEEEKV